MKQLNASRIVITIVDSEQIGVRCVEINRLLFSRTEQFLNAFKEDIKAITQKKPPPITTAS